MFKIQFSLAKAYQDARDDQGEARNDCFEFPEKVGMSDVLMALPGSVIVMTCTNVLKLLTHPIRK